MTMPHLMNCDHSVDGWCLDCVKELHDEKERLQNLVDKVGSVVAHGRLRRAAGVDCTVAFAAIGTVMANLEEFDEYFDAIVCAGSPGRQKK